MTTLHLGCPTSSSGKLRTPARRAKEPDTTALEKAYNHSLALLGPDYPVVQQLKTQWEEALRAQRESKPKNAWVEKQILNAKKKIEKAEGRLKKAHDEIKLRG